jgi:SAM-dependent methyltransferase
MAQTPSQQPPHGAPVAADPSRAASLVQRLAAAGYDWLCDRVDPLGGADHRRRLVEQATGAVLEIGAGTGRNLPLYRTATRAVALEPGPGMRARANHAAQAARVPVEVIDGTAAGFRMLELDQFDFQIMLPLVRPHVLGVAQRPASRRPPRSRPKVSQA